MGVRRIICFLSRPGSGAHSSSLCPLNKRGAQLPDLSKQLLLSWADAGECLCLRLPTEDLDQMPRAGHAPGWVPTRLSICWLQTNRLASHSSIAEPWQQLLTVAKFFSKRAGRLAHQANCASGVRVLAQRRLQQLYSHCI